MILVDCHVHIYDCFDLEIFFDSAYSNFKAEAVRIGHGDDFTPILLLTETKHENWFSRLSQFATRKKPNFTKCLGSWKIEPTTDEVVLRAIRNQNKRLYLFAGRQIKTKENLEVLALATKGSFVEEDTLSSVVHSILAEKGLVALPWSPGKWFGRRGKMVKRIIEDTSSADIFLADNYYRPWLWPTPLMFHISTDRVVRTLAGTDLLPFPSEQRRPGRYGCTIDEKLDETKLYDHLIQLLKRRNTQLRCYGHRIGTYCFLKNQILLRINKIRKN